MPLNSPYFSVSEFFCHSGESYPAEWVETRLQRLCDVLDPIRAEWGDVLIVVSGYRSPAYNEALRARSSGVASASQHVQGLAADIRPRERIDVAKLHGLVLRMFQAGKLDKMGGLGIYNGWIHIDARERPADGHLAQWTGAGFGSEPVA